MCGIAGIVKLHGPAAPEDVAAVQRMTDAQVHRGPDDEGIVSLSPASCFSVVLGHRRLAIIDLSEAGKQPMANEDETVWVTYNGEIYNFQELRAELSARGHAFRSRTDTEVLLHGYEEWGIEGLLCRLRGMFAFALCDSRRASYPLTHTPKFFLARDRLGKKPLYYAWDGRRLLFASELKALLASGLVERRLNPAALVAYLTFGSVPAPLTMLDGVEALLPGCYLTLEGGKLERKVYWRLAFEEDQRLTEEEAVERLRALLQEAVRLRLVADVPLGAFVSGGVDSSAIVALMREGTGGPIRTYSMVFEEKDFSEGSFARVVAQRFAAQHTEYVVTPDEVLRELPCIIEAMDQPTIDGVNVYFVSKVTRENGTVVALSGIGGDELFGGYASFRLVPWLYRAAQVAHAMPGGRWLSERAVSVTGPNGRAQKLRALFRSAPSPEMAYLAIRGLFVDEDLKALVNPDLLKQALRRFTPVGYLQEITAGSDGLRLPNTVSLLELRTYMHNQLLRDTDVMSMAHSLEVRVPFLDHVLVEFLATVPVKYKLTTSPKALLVKALNGKLPREVIERPKWTFTFPFEWWLAGPWRTWIEESLNNGNTEVFNPQGIQSLWSGFLKCRVHWSRVWALVVLQFWIDAILDR